MESDQFDATLGGTEHLPFSANSLKFSSARSIEIAAMTESILCPSRTKLIFQTLPVHMRRRVMSHNCKRLPIKVRQGHMEQLNKSGLPPKQKRPSRKFRRRPANLLNEYNRRKRNNIWLETHIWHAKRFHMIERWGHKIAYSPCDKAFRACYRASSAHCLMQDISYYTSIQIRGPLNTIKNKFESITSHHCNLGICSKASTSGSREGTIHIYKPKMYPFGYAGKINYLWEPGKNEYKTLWLFVHPSFIMQIKDIFDNLFLEQSDKNVPEKKRKLSINIEVSVKYLGNSFNIFRLTGPNSHAILTKTLKAIDMLEKNKTNDWISNLSNSSWHELNLEEKAKYWNSIQSISSPSQLPARMILGLIVKDPRLSRPNIRTKAFKESSIELDHKLLLSIPNFATTTPLWDINAVKTIKDKMLTNRQFIEKITETQLIPGEINENDLELQSVPVVLIQRTGSQIPNFKKIGFGSGWDVIVPPGYGLPFWQTFIMFGARAGGLRETESLAFEMGECYLPPDSEAGKEEEIRIEQQLKDKYFKLPSKKRVNYIKMGVNSPFICPWKILLSDWSDKNIKDFYVLRDKQLLSKLQICINQKCDIPYMEHSDSCLIPIYVQIEGKGNLKRHAHICLPKAGDIKSIKTLCEPLHMDMNEEARKQLRKEHKMTLKKSRLKRLKLKKQDNNKSQEQKVTEKSKRDPSEYVKKIRELWLPSTIGKVRYNCFRELLGYMSSGAFSFTQASSCGVGFIPYNAMKALLKSRENYVLIRNICSQKYRKANIKIIQP